jgi:archaeal flagellar protein FlaF
MAFASVLTSAIGILLLIITAYVLVGGTLATTETVVNAQTDMAALHVKMLGTSIKIESTNVSGPATLDISVRNTGSEPIIDLVHMDVLLMSAGTPPVLYTKDSGWRLDSISPDTVHPQQWDPGEVLNMTVTYTGAGPDWVQVTTGNGAYTSAYISYI